MADWNDPVITSVYPDVIDKFKARDIDTITMGLNPATNIPNGTMRFNRTANIFQEWNGSVWVDKILGVPGGGTGGSTPGSGGLGLGTMSVQNANSVEITGGSIVALNSFNLSCDLLFSSDGTRNVGSNTVRPNNIFVRNGLVIPVGADKWVTLA